MADKQKQDDAKVKPVTEKPVATGVPKERTVNPMAIRPEGVHVTISNTTAEIIKMAKKLGF